MKTSNDQSPLFQRTLKLVSQIPEGRVISYGKIAELISAPGCGRHVSYILSSSSRKYQLPWHRVISSSGKVAQHRSSNRQIKLLRLEKVEVNNTKVNFEKYGWNPSKKEVRKLLRGIPKHISIFLR